MELELKQNEIEKQLEEAKLELDKQIYNNRKTQLENVLSSIKTLEVDLQNAKSEVNTFEREINPFKTKINQLNGEIEKLNKLRNSHNSYVKKLIKLIPDVKEFTDNILNSVEKNIAEKKQLIGEQRAKINENENRVSKDRQKEIETKLKAMLELKTDLEQKILETSEIFDPEAYKEVMMNKYLGEAAKLVTDFSFDGDDDAKSYYSDGYGDVELFTMEYRLKTTGKSIEIYMKTSSTENYGGRSFSEFSISCGDYKKRIAVECRYIEISSKVLEKCPEMLPFFKAYGEEYDGEWVIEDLEAKRVIDGDHN